MKLSDKTIAILKNFSSISKTFLFRPGNILRTATVSGELAGRAAVVEEFDQIAGIPDLPNFIAILSLFSEPELTFKERSVTIASGRQRIEVSLAPESMIQAPPNRDLQPNRVVQFMLPKTDFSECQKATSVLGHTQLALVGKGGILTLEGLKIDDPTCNTYRLEVGKTDRTFSQIINKDILKILPRDYNVAITSNGIVEFVAEDVTYWVGCHTKSSKGDL